MYTVNGPKATPIFPQRPLRSRPENRLLDFDLNWNGIARNLKRQCQTFKTLSHLVCTRERETPHTYVWGPSQRMIHPSATTKYENEEE